MNNNIMSQATRSVTVLASEYTYQLTGDIKTLNIPIAGTYKIETWGASGGGTTIMKGKGGYTSGTFKFSTLDTIYIAVGGQGTTGLSNTAAHITSYNVCYTKLLRHLLIQLSYLYLQLLQLHSL